MSARQSSKIEKTAQPEVRRTLVALLSPCGTGNLGDAAIQDAALANLGARLGSAVTFLGITLNPPDTEGRHGIACVPLDCYSRAPAYGAPLPALSEEKLGAIPAPVRLLREQFARHARDYKQVHAGRSRLRRALMGLRLEARHWALALRLLKHVDLLVIAGGGQLDDLWGGASGHPLALFKWRLAARLQTCRVVALSIGAGHLGAWKTRALLSCALRDLSYESYRDRRTARLASRLSRRMAPVVPDLALSRPVANYPQAAPRSVTDLCIAIAPMAYMDPRAWPTENASLFARYTGELSETIGRLAAQGARVIIFNTTPADLRVARDLYARSQTDLAPGVRERVLLSEASTVEGVLRTLGAAHLSIASRLHAVVLSTLLCRPVIAVPCEWKVHRYMFDCGLRGMKSPFKSVTAAALEALVARAIADYDSLVAQLTRMRRECDASLAAQYDLVAGFAASACAPT